MDTAVLRRVPAILPRVTDWQQVLDERVSATGFARLKGAVEALSEAYREGKATRSAHLDPELTATAYLATRFPATRAAAGAAAKWTAQRVSMAPESLLDLGAGCGAASLALAAEWPSLRAITALEHSASMVALGKVLVPQATWRTANFAGATPYGAHDVVVFGYSLGEAGLGFESCLEKAWSCAGQLLLIIEPGTPAGYARVLAAREWLLGQGATIAAPCPGPAPCPLAQGDWCHFSVRLSRTSLHRRLKEGSLGYEDEKFSYLAAWRGELAGGPPRVLRHPYIEAGRITLELCDAPERRKEVVLKRDKAAFRLARKLRWGDDFDLNSAADDAGAKLESGDHEGPDGPQNGH